MGGKMDLYTLAILGFFVFIVSKSSGGKTTKRDYRKIIWRK